MTPEQIETFTPSVLWRMRKKSKIDEAGWKKTHEQLFSSVLSVAWPPNIEFLPHGLLPREAELFIAADIVSPPTKIGWQWFDANHSVERTLGFEADGEHRSEGGAVHLKNPWSDLVPTFTCNSVMIGRHFDKDSTTTWKILNALEGFQMMGWGLEDWKQMPLSSNEIIYSDLVTMLGNMWSLNHYLPVVMSLFWCLGSVTREEVDFAGDDDEGSAEIVSSEDPYITSDED